MNYQGSRVLVFGGLGFIGLNLVQALIQQGANVTVASRSCPPLALEWLNRMAGGRALEIRQADLNMPERYHDILAHSDIVFNLAGHSGAAKSLIEAYADMQSNVEGNLALLEAVRQQPHRPRVVFTSSRLVYGPTGKTPVTEGYPLQPTSIYGLHKLTVEHYYRLYFMHYDIPYAIMRLTNPYGPYQQPDRRGYGIVNAFVMQALRDEKITIYGEGRQLRDYIYIEDVVRALLCMGQDAAAVNQIINVGYGRSISLVEIASLIVQLTRRGHIEFVPWPVIDQKVETGDFVCDIGLARQVLGWEPLVDWEAGFARTIEAYIELSGQV